MGVADVGTPAYPWLEGEVELVRQAIARLQPLHWHGDRCVLPTLPGGKGALPGRADEQVPDLVAAGVEQGAEAAALRTAAWRLLGDQGALDLSGSQYLPLNSEALPVQ